MRHSIASAGLGLLLILCGCDADPVTPAAAPSTGPAANASPLASASPSGLGSESLTSLPPASAGAIETAFARCEAAYLNSLKTRQIPNPTLTRLTPFISEAAAGDSRDYYLRLSSSFVYNEAESESQSRLVREVGRCRARIGPTGQLTSQSWTTLTEPLESP